MSAENVNPRNVNTKGSSQLQHNNQLTTYFYENITYLVKEYKTRTLICKQTCDSVICM